MIFVNFFNPDKKTRTVVVGPFYEEMTLQNSKVIGDGMSYMDAHELVLSQIGDDDLYTESGVILMAGRKLKQSEAIMQGVLNSPERL